jgi:hypothetical protein
LPANRQVYQRNKTINFKKNKKIREPIKIFYSLSEFEEVSKAVGGEGFEPPKASANGFTVRPGSPTPASARF